MTHRFTGRLFLGLTIIALGVLFTLDNLGLANAHEALRWWPVLPLAYGLARLTGLGGRPSWLSGSIFTIVGAWMLLHNFGMVDRGVLDLWPILLVLWGIAIMRGGGRILRRGRGWYGLGYTRRGGWRTSNSWTEPGNPSVIIGAAGRGSAEDPGRPAEGAPAEPRTPGSEDDASTFSTVAFMGSVARKVVSQEFKGGDVVAMMGGGDIDLRSARIAGDTARLEVNLVMGGVNLFVPEDWSVEFSGLPIMGSVEDRTKRTAGETRGRLVITGVILMSSVIIRN
jgi:hypothetical protein